MKKPKKMFNGQAPGPRYLLILLLLGLFGVSIALNYYSSPSKEPIMYSELVTLIENGRIESAVIDGHTVSGSLKNGETFTVNVVPSESLWEKLQAAGAKVSVIPPESFTWFYYLVGFVLAILLMFVIFMAFSYFRNSQDGGGSNRIFSVGKSKARFYSANEVGVKFSDVAGVEEAKEDLLDIIDFLKAPKKFGRIGAKIPRGVLLSGDPGNGKTMLAKAVAGEAGCPFFSISGSDFVEVFVGVGASRVRDLFNQARRHSPCMVFIDEIDAVGKKRGVGTGGGHDEREQTLNQILSEMDGFATQPGAVIVLAATNRVDVLDSALMRPGRFDRVINVPYPDQKAREKILGVHVRTVKLDPKVNLGKIARGTSRFSGAQLANLINEAALRATKAGKKRVEIEDFEQARDKIIVGAARNLVRSEEEIKKTAVHEVGHALLNLLLPETDPFHKVTIMPRGRALGISWSLPVGDKYGQSSEELLSYIISALGGLVAEKMVYGITGTGVSQDLKQATEIAHDMVCSYGMSPLGIVSYNPGNEGYWNSEIHYSQETAANIDKEVRRILDECRERAAELLTENREKFDIFVEELIKKETLHAEEVYELLGLEPREIHSFNPEVDLEEPHDGDDEDISGGGDGEPDGSEVA
ncbi:ATP-dependent zinc metalloprotease FtsH [Candidatus Babeliales bacterium]|nr:ATP-dependent zinc metalloprotease FtsH [Candidatus Babeliales bacterium]